MSEPVVSYCLAGMRDGQLLRGRGTRSASATTPEGARQLDSPRYGDQIALVRVISVWDAKQGRMRLVDETIVEVV